MVDHSTKHKIFNKSMTLFDLCVIVFLFLYFLMLISVTVRLDHAIVLVRLGPPG